MLKAPMNVPEPPQIKLPGHRGIPAEVREQWRQLYAKEFEGGFARAARKAEAEAPRLPIDAEKRDAYVLGLIPARTLTRLRQAAEREANKLLSVPAPEGYTEALALPEWQVLTRREKSVEKSVDDESATRVLLVVTIDGRKFRFPVPAEQVAA